MTACDVHICIKYGVLSQQGLFDMGMHVVCSERIFFGIHQ